jgi:hypothetical protein
LATKGVIVLNAVGVDISCGMCAVKTIVSWTCNQFFNKKATNYSSKFCFFVFIEI